MPYILYTVSICVFTLHEIAAFISHQQIIKKWAWLKNFAQYCIYQ